MDLLTFDRFDTNRWLLKFQRCFNVSIQFGINLTIEVIWECFEKDQRQFLKKTIFFHLRFFVFLGICPIVFELISLKTSSFHRSSTFCDMRRQVSAKIEINFFCFTLHPLRDKNAPCFFKE